MNAQDIGVLLPLIIVAAASLGVLFIRKNAPAALVTLIGFVAALAASFAAWHLAPRQIGGLLVFDRFVFFGISLVLAASIFHYGTYSIGETKKYLAQKGIPVRN